ncbi:cell division protein SepF [Staphylococcus xylosus]|uniref:Cell division protein SepF n=1 Tax=Staphylococcus xylosus TaxID=1288 RepID=A0A418I7X7_STAXY|nr:cell division protein SepF [Staphylococcus xylosus]AID01121.1 cell division protein SepF [Staphylococcus xylosus]AID43054.1 FtsZ-interacting protein related to cell division [Staphylococcus xylosus]ARD74215.1 cell division protein SepF [Staphylococcus xylosus]KTW22130.1 cell division protein SepF [Staphylococcus xylosus]MBE6180312.1 cell division protein SepF [Staphylococcus xylosus]
MALKDLFNGFFVVEEEDDELEAPPEEEQNRNQNKQQAQSQSNFNEQSNNGYTEKTRSIQSVPKKQSTRLQQSSGERKYQMNNSSSKNNTRNVVNMNNQEQDQFDFTQESSKMCLFEPRVFSDTQDIADELKNRRATLVNLQRIDKVSAKRIIDFLSGTVYAIGGDIQRVGSDIFLCTPDNVEVAGSITDQIENMEYQGE